MKQSIYVLALVLLLLGPSAAQESEEALIHVAPLVSWFDVSFAGIDRDMRALVSGSTQAPIPFGNFGRDFAYGLVLTTPVRGQVRIGLALNYFQSRGDNLQTLNIDSTAEVQSMKYAVAVLMPRVVIEIARLTGLGDLTVGVRIAAGPTLIKMRSEVAYSTSFPVPPFMLPFTLTSECEAVVPEVDLDFDLRYRLWDFLSLETHAGWITTIPKEAAPGRKINGQPITWNSSAGTAQRIELGLKGWSCGAGLELHF